MRELFKEYGGSVAAVVGSLFFFGVLAVQFLAEDGLFAQIIKMWGNGGC